MAVSDHTTERVQEFEIGAHQGGYCSQRQDITRRLGCDPGRGEQQDDRPFYTSSSGTRWTNGARNPHFLPVHEISLLLLVGRERPRKLTAQMQKAHGSLTWRAESKRQKGGTHVWPALGFYPFLLLFLITACSGFLGVPILLPQNCFQESVRISRKVLLQQSDPILPPHNFFQEIHQYF
jgi:hypothetical protein